ncbi:MAG: aminotransferase class IV [Clostridia bacterium]|nr:aminotransferase class IV [Clostridia bacterium]
MNSYAYYNGDFGKKDSIKIPLSDRSIFFGDAVYDAAIGCYDRILWENDHIDRLLLNAKRLEINHSYTKKFLSELLREIAVKSMIESYFLYIQISRNLEKRVHSAFGSGANLLITVDHINIDDECQPLKLTIADDLRYGYCDIKTVNLLPAVIASTNAEKRGYDEVVLVKNGVVTECVKSNISIIKRGRILSHPKSHRILPGITRDHLLRTCVANQIEVEERPFTVEELFSADEILVTSTSKLCRPVSFIDDISVGGKNALLADFLCRKIYEEYAIYCKT